MSASEKCYKEKNINVQFNSNTNHHHHHINNYHVLSTYYVSGTVLKDLHRWLNLLFTTDTTATVDRYYYFCHFTDEKSLSLWQSWDVVIKRHPHSLPWVSLGHMGSHLISQHDGILSV